MLRTILWIGLSCLLATAAFAAESTSFLSPLFLTEGATREPWGAEDLSAEHHTVRVPEPLLFDLVRPLGARRGEVEINTLAMFPWRKTRPDPDRDPFGSGASTPDRAEIEWAPEVEYAFADNWAIEFEFPLEGSRLEAYKLGLQPTFGTSFNDHYIHGFQLLVMPDVDWERWSTTCLYLAGFRFDETWSALLMGGFRVDLEGDRTSESFERIFNASLFADISERSTVGVETNFAGQSNGDADFILVPQWHFEITDRLQIQSGLGFGFTADDRESSGILRVIFSP